LARRVGHRAWDLLRLAARLPAASGVGIGCGRATPMPTACCRRTSDLAAPAASGRWLGRGRTTPLPTAFFCCTADLAVPDTSGCRAGCGRQALPLGA